ncbi:MULTISPECIES: hypothetical protein [Clostridium]|uniref:Uncharacterized protein n=1 Tax=Clostridium ragsdalei P11 TaxID=1353534 RepID=A0A1A6ANW2_9CLOT|nr:MULTISPECIES: hypothetical protein [Clostridium]OBR91745.1 hypothetical protein CLRAG_27240 [Clostridium ragsdalei P11]
MKDNVIKVDFSRNRKKDPFSLLLLIKKTYKKFFYSMFKPCKTKDKNNKNVIRSFKDIS